MTNPWMICSWTSPSETCTSIQKFRYNGVGTSVSDEALAEKTKPTTTAQRYQKALQTTNLIANELAGISDEEEYEAHTAALRSYWRNIRQAKRGRVDGSECDDGQKRARVESASPSPPQPSENPTPAHPESFASQVSQPHSFYADEIGAVPILDTSAFSFARVESSVFVSQELSTEATASDLLGSVSEVADLHVDAVSDVASRDVAVDTDSVQDAIAKEHVPTRINQTPKNKSSRMQAGRGMENEWKHPDDGDSDFENKIPVHLNRRAPKVGNPGVDLKKKASEQRVDRAVFVASEAARRALGEVTLDGVLAALDDERPPVTTALKRLASIPTKYRIHENKKPKYEKQTNPVLVLDVFFLLRKKLLAASIKQFPLANSSQDPIHLGGSQSSSSQTGSSSKTVELVRIADVGAFSRATIETMVRVQTLREQCEDGVKFVKWLRDEVRPGVPAVMADLVSSSADKMETTWPTARVGGLESSSDFVAAMAYRIQPPNELNDALIRAACRRMEQAYSHVRHAGTPDAKPAGTKGSRVQRVVPSLASCIAELTKEEGVNILLLPVNFGNAHWCGIMVHVKDKRIYTYDSLNGKMYKNSLERIALSIVDSALHGYTVIALNSPIQFDGYSCGFFVCMKFWRMVDRTVSNNMSELSLNARRFEFIHFVMTGMKPSVAQIPAGEAGPEDPVGVLGESCVNPAVTIGVQAAFAGQDHLVKTQSDGNCKDGAPAATSSTMVQVDPVPSSEESCTNPGRVECDELRQALPNEQTLHDDRAMAAVAGGVVHDRLTRTSAVPVPASLTEESHVTSVQGATNPVDPVPAPSADGPI